MLFVASGGEGSQARPNVLLDWRPLAVPGWHLRASPGVVVEWGWPVPPVTLAAEWGGVSAPTVVGLALRRSALLRPCVGAVRSLRISRGEAIVRDEVPQVLSCSMQDSSRAVDSHTVGRVWEAFSDRPRPVPRAFLGTVLVLYEHLGPEWQWG